MEDKKPKNLDIDIPKKVDKKNSESLQNGDVNKTIEDIRDSASSGIELLNFIRKATDIIGNYISEIYNQLEGRDNDIDYMERACVNKYFNSGEIDWIIIHGNGELFTAEGKSLQLKKPEHKEIIDGEIEKIWLYENGELHYVEGKSLQLKKPEHKEMIDGNITEVFFHKNGKLQYIKGENLKFKKTQDTEKFTNKKFRMISFYKNGKISYWS